MPRPVQASLTKASWAAVAAVLALGAVAAPALAQEQPKAPCGGDLAVFLDGVRAEAVAKGIPQDAIDSLFERYQNVYGQAPQGALS